MAFLVPVTPLTAGGPERIGMVDYGSAGNTWDRASSDFRVWLPMGGDDPFGSELVTT